MRAVWGFAASPVVWQTSLLGYINAQIINARIPQLTKVKKS
jgi:hypothetical protein